MQPSGAIQLTYFEVGMSALLVVLLIIVSRMVRIGVEKQLLIASLRTVGQLLLVGVILGTVFALKNPWLIGIIILVMIGLAGQAAVSRPKFKLRRNWMRTVTALLLSGVATSFVISAGVVQVRPWYTPQYLIPLLGMILGNGLTGISLCIESLLSSFSEKAAQVETDLAHGATWWEASRDPFREAVRRGLIPILNSMTIAGIISLPGMMTGQILAGEDPANAVRYQIVVMFMIVTATMFSCLIINYLMCRSLFNERHQLLREKIFTKP